MNKRILAGLVSVAVSLSALAQAEKKDEPKSDAAKTDAKEVAVIKTSEGEMVLEFWPDVAPVTVENFKILAKTERLRAPMYQVPPPRRRPP